MKKVFLIIFFSMVVFGLFAYYQFFAMNKKSKATNNGSAKYTMRERIGYGFPTQVCDDKPAGCIPRLELYTKPDNEYHRLNAGWYTDWSAGIIRVNRVYTPIGGPRPQYDIDYIGLIGAYSAKTAPSNCRTSNDVEVKHIRSNPDKYPNGMTWTIGNEVGWDDRQTPVTYAKHFSGWYRCLKEINPTFKIGTGVILTDFLLPIDDPTSPNLQCVLNNYVEPGERHMSGYQFFLRFMHELKTNLLLRVNGEIPMPDAVFGHIYTACAPNSNVGGWGSPYWVDTNAFKAGVLRYRILMAATGLKNADFIIKEYGPLMENGWNGLTEDQKKQKRREYMTATFEYMAVDGVDPVFGNPEDQNRLVQRWAWFPLSGFTYVEGMYSYQRLALMQKKDFLFNPDLAYHYITLVNRLIHSSNQIDPTATDVPQTPTVTPYPTSRSDSGSGALPVGQCGVNKYCFQLPQAYRDAGNYQLLCNKDYTQWGGPNLLGYMQRSPDNGYSNCGYLQVCCKVQE